MVGGQASGKEQNITVDWRQGYRLAQSVGTLRQATQQSGCGRIPFKASGDRSGPETDFVDDVKPLAVVSAIVDVGTEVVFSQGGSLIKSLPAGEHILVQREKGAYSMGVDVDAVEVSIAREAEASGFNGAGLSLSHKAEGGRRC